MLLTTTTAIRLWNGLLRGLDRQKEGKIKDKNEEKTQCIKYSLLPLTASKIGMLMAAVGNGMCSSKSLKLGSASADCQQLPGSTTEAPAQDRASDTRLHTVTMPSTSLIRG